MNKKTTYLSLTGGLGNQLTEHLSLNYTCLSVGSKMLDVTNEEQVKEFLDKNGFLLKKNNDYFSPDLGLILEDLHDENVLTNNGVPFFIDTVFYLDTSFFNK